MGPLRKEDNLHMEVQATYTFGTDGVVERSFPPEAYAYHGDISEEALKQLQERANACLDDGEWTVIDGYVGSE